MFENNKAILELLIEESFWAVRQITGKGSIEFKAISIYVDPDDEEFTIGDKEFGRQVDCLMILHLSRVGLFEGILSYARGCKLETLCFRFDSVNKMLLVMDKV